MKFLLLLISIVLISLLTVGCMSSGISNRELKGAMEAAYMEGQIHALTQDIKVAREDNDWVWIQSPWNDMKPEHKYYSKY